MLLNTDLHNSETRKLRSVTERITEIARNAGEQVALTCGGSQTTYGTLVERATEVAHQLLTLGVAKGDVVIFMPSRNLDTISLVLGVMMSGAVACPVNPDLGADRLRTIVKCARAKLYLDTTVEGIPAQWADVLADCEITRTIISSEFHPSANELPKIQPSDGCYLLFTTGTTGNPKGVLMPHQALSNLVAWDEEFNDYRPRRVHLQFAQLHFDIAFHELFGALATGGVSVVATNEERSDPWKLLQRLHSSQVEHAYLPYSVLNQLALAARDWRPPLALRDVTTAGEPLKVNSHIRSFFKKTSARLRNNYGSTEMQDVTSLLLDGDPENWPDLPTIGRPIANMTVGILTENGLTTETGVEGQIVVRGPQVASGYVSEDTERLSPLPSIDGKRNDEYVTSDVGKLLPDGSIEIVGRVDKIVKIRGQRVDISLVEATIEKLPAVDQSTVIDVDISGRRELIAFVILRGTDDVESVRLEINRYVEKELGRPATPFNVIALPSFPRTSTGKVDRNRLIVEATSPSNKAESKAITVATIWREVLNANEYATFEEARGDSLSAMQLASRLRAEFNVDLAASDFRDDLTVHELMDLVATRKTIGSAIGADMATRASGAVAIIGMSGEFPGAESVAELWDGLLKSKVFLTPSTNDPVELRSAEGFVPVGAFIDDHFAFDADFFGISDREAALMDPQHRIFLQCAWKALESAGYAPDQLRRRTGVFSASGTSTYLINNVLPTVVAKQSGPFLAHRLIRQIDDIFIEQGNAGEHVSMRVSHKLNLKGPSISVSSACSGGLVAVHQAVQAIRSGDAEMALAGGVSISSPQHVGYFAHDDVILSPSGVCRPFDADADGAVFGNGCAVLVLKDLDLAIADGDSILATIVGSAINNDGSRKRSYAGPSIDGQVEVIEAALRDAGLDPADVNYIEAHGTGTRVGDPIELEALARTYGAADTESRCIVGATKANIGHLDEAAGAIGLMKAVMCVQNAQIPPIPTFRDLNRRSCLEGSRLEIARGETQSWPGGTANTRRAGVTSLGIGGTNCHLVIESFRTPASLDTRQSSPELFVLSAESCSQVLELAADYLNHLKGPGLAQSLRDICMTACIGRRHQRYRVAFVVNSKDDLSDRLAELLSHATNPVDSSLSRRLVGLFTGQGCQWAGMGQDLARVFPVFSDALDRCAQYMDRNHDIDLRGIMFSTDLNAGLLDTTEYAQPAIFAFEYSMACLLSSFGSVFSSVAGHSFGEIAALVVANALSLEDGCRFAVERGRLSSQLPDGAGAMAVVTGDTGAIARLRNDLPPTVSVAAVNSPTVIVISGEADAIHSLVTGESSHGCDLRLLPISHAFHSNMMRPIVDEYQKVLGELKFGNLTVPMVSSVTGTSIPNEVNWISYFTDHLLGPVNFYDALQTMTRDHANVFVELGSKPMLVGLGMDNDTIAGRQWIPSSRSDGALRTFLEALARMHCAGLITTLEPIGAVAPWQRIMLPTYRFQKVRHYVDASTQERYCQKPDNGLVHRQRKQVRSTWLGEHLVNGDCILPGTVLLDLAASGASQALGTDCIELRDFQIKTRVPADPIYGTLLQVDALKSDFEDEYLIETKIISPADGHLTLATTAFAKVGLAPLDAPPMLPKGMPEVTPEKVYATYEGQGISLGPSFRSLTKLQAMRTAGISHALLPQHLKADNQFFGPHPVLVDTALQVIEAVVDDQQMVSARIPIGIDHVVVRNKASDILSCDAWNCVRQNGEISFDFTLRDGGGEILVSGRGFRQLELPQARPSSLVRREVEIELPQADIAEEELAGVLITNADTDIPEVYEYYYRVNFDSKFTLSQKKFDYAVIPLECFTARGTSLLETVSSMTAFFKSLAVLLDSSSVSRLVVAGPESSFRHPEHGPTSQALFALARSFSIEQGLPPPLCLQVAECDPSSLPRLVARELSASVHANELILGTHRRAAILFREEPTTEETVHLRPDAAYVITGGLGSLGPIVAEALIAAGARNIHILTYSKPSEAALRKVTHLETLGCAVCVHVVDVSDQQALRRCINEIAADSPVRGVFHAAGRASDGVLTSIDRADLERTLAAKAMGALNLHNCFSEPHDLDLFVLFSSTASSQGAAGQSLHATACGVLDGLSRYRISEGLPATCINWGVWKESAFFVDHPESLKRFSLEGDAGLSHAQGAGAFLSALVHPFARLEIVNHQPIGEPISPTSPHFSLAEKANSITVGSKSIEIAVIESVARLSGRRVTALGQRQLTWRELGFDSLMLIELRNSLRRILGDLVTAGAIMRSKNVDDLIALLSDVQGGRESKLTDSPDNPCVVLIPGITGDSFDFVSLLPHLSGMNHTILSYPTTINPWLHPPTADDVILPMVDQAAQFAEGKNVIIIGYSFGGQIANQVALHLEERGTEVQDMIVIDIPAEIATRPRIPPPENADFGPESFAKMLARNPAEAFAKLDRVCLSGSPDISLLPMASIYWTNVLISAELAAKSLRAPITLVRAQEVGALGQLLPDAAETVEDPAWGWHDMSRSQFSMHILSGDHFTIMDNEHVHELASVIKHRVRTAGTLNS